MIPKQFKKGARIRWCLVLGKDPPVEGTIVSRDARSNALEIKYEDVSRAVRLREASFWIQHGHLKMAEVER